jgi:hypothetical protein
MFQPDSIHAVKVGGVEYLITANEGGSKDYSGFTLDTAGFNEEARARDITLSSTQVFIILKILNIVVYMLWTD